MISMHASGPMLSVLERTLEKVRAANIQLFELGVGVDPALRVYGVPDNCSSNTAYGLMCAYVDELVRLEAEIKNIQDAGGVEEAIIAMFNKHVV